MEDILKELTNLMNAQGLGAPGGEYKARSGFVPPNEERRTKALGDLGCEC